MVERMELRRGSILRCLGALRSRFGGQLREYSFGAKSNGKGNRLDVVYQLRISAYAIKSWELVIWFVTDGWALQHRLNSIFSSGLACHWV